MRFPVPYPSYKLCSCLENCHCHIMIAVTNSSLADTGGDRMDLKQNAPPPENCHYFTSLVVPVNAPVTGLVLRWPDPALTPWENSNPRAFVESNQQQLFNIIVAWAKDTKWDVRGFPKTLNEKPREWNVYGGFWKSLAYSWGSRRPCACQQRSEKTLSFTPG